MKILDNYLIKRFYLFLIAGLSLFIFIFIIVDLSDNLSSYIDSGKTFMHIAGIYISQIPSLIMLLYPVGAIIALFFSIGIFVRNNELTAVKSAGISVYRFLAPLLISVLVVSALLFVFNETVVVKANRLHAQLTRNKSYSYDTARDFHVFQDKNTLIKGRFISRKTGIMTQPEVFIYDSTNTVREIFSADEAKYTNGLWHFKNLVKTEIGSNVIREYTDNEMLPMITVTPDDILIDRSNTDIYSINYLMKSLSSIKESGYENRKQVSEIAYRFFYILITFIVILIASAFVVNIKNTGMIFGLAMSILLSFVYWGVLQSFRSAGESGAMNPVMALMIPNLIFLLLGSTLLLKARK